MVHFGCLAKQKNSIVTLVICLEPVRLVVRSCIDLEAAVGSFDRDRLSISPDDRWSSAQI